MASRSTEHAAVVRLHGKASTHSCVDCGGSASDWSHVHDTDRADPTNYKARCRKCHIAYDMTDEWRENAKLARIGHAYAGVGESHSRAKLSDEQIAAIRSSDLSRMELAELYGVTPQYIGQLRSGQYRNHTVGSK